MKIAHILWGLGVGGVETMLVDIANYQVQNNDVSIIIVNDILDPFLEKKLDPRVKLCQCKRAVGSKNPLPLFKLNWFLFKIKPNIIHVHMEGIVKFIKVQKSKPIVRTIHNITSSNSEFGRYTRLFSISEAVKELTKDQGFDSIVVYNGIHFSDIKSDSKAANEKLKIVDVGRLENDKGQKILIEAAKIVKEKLGDVFSVDFIGSGKNEEILKNLTRELGLESCINFLGIQPRSYIYSHLCNYNLYVQPSLFEGFGLTIAEAVTAKVPVITSNLEGPMEVIAGGKYGIPFECGNAQDLAEKIIAFINKEISVDTEAAWNYALQNFNIEVTSQKYIDEYNKLIKT